MKLGPHGERVGVKFLKRLGYRIIKRNYTCPGGEIDIIAADGDTLAFVEVKTRRSDQAADPENSINLHKQRQIAHAARTFIAQTSAQYLPARFDVLSIIIPERGKPQIEYFIDAFGPVSGRRR